LEESWERTYEDPIARVQEEYLGSMGQRICWYASILEVIDRKSIHHDRLFEIMLFHPRPEIYSNRRSVPVCPFGDCADLDAIEEFEHKSSAVTGLGDSAPARVLAMSNAQQEEFYALRFNKAHMIYDQCRDVIRIKGLPTHVPFRGNPNRVNVYSIVFPLTRECPAPPVAWVVF
jgi:hypothetical protein